MIGIDRARVVLAVGAHPDDVEVGAGGLIARLARAGAHVLIAVLCLPTELERRAAEAREAARRLGSIVDLPIVARPQRLEDTPMHEVVGRLDRLIAARRPDLVVTHAADDLHWDHGLAHRATLAALRRTPCDVLAYGSLSTAPAPRDTCFVDVEATLGAKLAAIAAHESQLARLDVERVRERARWVGGAAGLPFAESFEVLRLRL